MEKEVYRKGCPYCPKILMSLNKQQLDYNFEQHVTACKKKRLTKLVDKRG